MNLLHIMLVFGLFGAHAFAMISQKDISNDVIDDTNVDGKGDNEITEKEPEEEARGNNRDETEEKDNTSDEEIAKKVKDIEKAEMDDSSFAIPQSESEQDEIEAGFALGDNGTDAFKEKCINKKSDDYCIKAAKEGKCKNRTVRAECNQACLVCCADLPLPEVCSKSRLSLCNYPDTEKPMRFYCPKLCRFCGKAIEPPPCFSSDYGCCWDRKTNASALVGSQDDGCPECKDNLSETFCSRFAPDCPLLQHPKTKKLCPKTCRVCKRKGPDDSKPLLCIDDEKHELLCPQYKDQGLCDCDFDKERMTFLCSKTCGFCKPLNDDQDVAPRCSVAKANGACQKSPEEMEKMCPLTCDQ